MRELVTLPTLPGRFDVKNHAIRRRSASLRQSGHQKFFPHTRGDEDPWGRGGIPKINYEHLYYCNTRLQRANSAFERKAAISVFISQRRLGWEYLPERCYQIGEQEHSTDQSRR